MLASNHGSLYSYLPQDVAVIGQVVGGYQILERLGAGGMGVVYRARDPRLERDVAIKFISPSSAADETAKARFLREARAASALDHANICAIHGVDETDDGQLYIVMGYYPGENLSARIARQRPTPGQGLELAVQIAAGVAKAHEVGVVHRDLKPSNVMVTNDGVVKILDFGLAKRMESQDDDLTQTGTSMGSPWFMSPEQVRGESLDARTDVWSMGVMLHELLAGERPFARESMAASLYAVVNDPTPKMPDTVPARLREIVASCLQKDRNQRWPDAASLYRELHAQHRLLGDDDTRTQPLESIGEATVPLSGTTAVLPTRRSSVRQGLLAVLFLAVLASAGWGGWKLLNPAVDPLRVVVVSPRVTADVEGAGERAELSVRADILKSLGALRDVVPIDPTVAGQAEGGSLAMARALNATDLITAEVAVHGLDMKVALQRIDVVDGSVVWSGEVSAPTNSRLPLSKALLGRVRSAFPERRVRRGMESFDVDPVAYERLMELVATKPTEASLDSLRSATDQVVAIQRLAPSFAEAYVWEARFAYLMFWRSREVADYDRCVDAVKKARELAPDSPLPLSALLRLQLIDDRVDEARITLKELERVTPGDVGLFVWKAKLAYQTQDSEKAVALMTEAASRLPSALNLFELAEMQYNLNRFDAAISTLEDLLDRFPGRREAQSKLAEIELLYGDPARADELYTDLIERTGAENFHVNRGLARELLGQYELALADMEVAMEQAPKNAYYRLNLADCLALVGRQEEAKRNYALALTQYLPLENLTSWDDLMVAAQCLVHLDRKDEAIEAVNRALRSANEEAEMFYLASLVYAVTGERASAVYNANEALRLGTEPRWFWLPWFDPIRDELPTAAQGQST